MPKVKPRKERLAAAEARQALSGILREFAELEEPADSIADRAVRLGIYNRDAGVLLPLSDFESALETEEILDDILLELTALERLSHEPKEWISLEDAARELGLAKELGLD